MKRSEQISFAAQVAGQVILDKGDPLDKLPGQFFSRKIHKRVRSLAYLLVAANPFYQLFFYLLIFQDFCQEFPHFKGECNLVKHPFQLVVFSRSH